MVTRSCRGEIAITKNLSLARWKNTGRPLIKENDTKTIDYLWVIGIFLEEWWWMVSDPAPKIVHLHGH